jgi:hypothetical protein
MSTELQETAGSRAAIAGLVFGVLYLAGFVALRRLPGPEASAEDIMEFYSSTSNRRLATVMGAFVVPIAGIALLWFTAAIRHRVASLATRQDELLSTVQLLSAALYVAMLFIATAIVTGPAIAVDNGAVTVEEVVDEKHLLVVGDTIFVVFALRAAGVFIAAGTTRAMRSGLIPRWFAIVSYVLVLVLLLTVARARVVTLLFPLWVMVMSVVVLRRRRSLGAAASA